MAPRRKIMKKKAICIAVALVIALAALTGC